MLSTNRFDSAGGPRGRSRSGRVSIGAFAAAGALALLAISGAKAQSVKPDLTITNFAITGAALTTMDPAPTVLAVGKAQGGMVAGAVGAVSPFPIGIRIGAMVSPQIKFAGGIDVTIKQLARSGFVPRFDGDIIATANFAGLSALGDVTAGILYSHGIVAGSRIYFGGGIGPYFADQTRFGGKLILGGDLTNRFGLEANLHFPGFGDPLLTVQARFHL